MTVRFLSPSKSICLCPLPLNCSEHSNQLLFMICDDTARLLGSWRQRLTSARAKSTISRPYTILTVVIVDGIITAAPSPPPPYADYVLYCVCHVWAVLKRQRLVQQATLKGNSLVTLKKELHCPSVLTQWQLCSQSDKNNAFCLKKAYRDIQIKPIWIFTFAKKNHKTTICLREVDLRDILATNTRHCQDKSPSKCLFLVDSIVAESQISTVVCVWS